MAETTRTEQVTTNIPEWARPYAAQLFGRTFGEPTTGAGGLLSQPYRQYEGQMVAGFNPLQQAAFSDLAAMGISPQTLEASGLASLAGQRAGQLGQYQAYQPRQFYRAPRFREGAVGFERTMAPQLERFQMGAPREVSAQGLERYTMGPAERVGAERFGLGAMQEYMSPYMQGVIEQQKRGAIEDYRRQIPGIGAAAVQAGAKGGTREALIRAEAQRGLAERLGGIEATGLQQAYQQAAQQFGADRAAAMQAALANQAAGMQVGQTNLQALINQAQFGGGQSLQAQLANQAAQQQAAQANLQAALQTQGLGAQTGLQSQQLNQAAQLQAQQQALAQLAQANQFAQQNAAQRAQYGLAGAQLGEQSRQFGANLGLQGLQQQLAAAGALGGLGQQQYQQGLGISQAQLGAGQQVQGIEQQQLQAQYQDFLNRMQFPYRQLEFASGILRGFQPTGQTTTLYQPGGSTLGGMVGTGAGLAGLFGALGG